MMGLIIGLGLGASEPGLDAYQSAESAYQKFIKNPSQVKYHHNWEKLIAKFDRVAKDYPTCSKADSALFKAGKLWWECSRYSSSRKDKENALIAFGKVVNFYPKSSLADDALLARGEIYLELGDKNLARQEFEKLITQYPSGDCLGKAKTQLKKLGYPSSNAGTTPSAPLRKNDAIALLLQDSGPESESYKNSSLTELIRIRYWSSESYTRVVIDLTQRIEYTSWHLLKPDPSLGTPPRLYTDLKGTILSSEFKAQYPYKDNCYELPIGDGLLKRARAGQYQPEVVRIVLDIDSIQDFEEFALPGGEGAGYRLVIDVYGEKKPEIKIITQPGTTPQPIPAKRPTKPLTIVIDPGHGGGDPGAIGPNKLKEKDISLAVSKALEQKLKKELPEAKIILTRRDDRELSLVERTAKANALEADLFISIHCNATPDHNAYGIETYYLDNTTDRASLKLAARENFVSEQVMSDAGSDINKILADLATNSKVNESIPLAHHIQKAMIDELSKNYSAIKNLGVKKAPFWVLTGATMPCVLVELSFISHPREEKRLSSPVYQEALARGISLGMKRWLKENPSLTGWVAN